MRVNLIGYDTMKINLPQMIVDEMLQSDMPDKEMQADLFNYVCNKWAMTECISKGYIEMGFDDLKTVSTFKNSDYEMLVDNTSLFNYMNYVKLLDVLWLDTALENNILGNVQEHDQVNAETLESVFEIQEITTAKDSATKELLGIYSLKIKPRSRLASILEKGSVVVFDSSNRPFKAIQFAK